MFQRLFSGFLFFSTLGVVAETATNSELATLDLEELEQEAQVNNAELRVMESRLETARGQSIAAGTWGNPEFGFAPGIRREKAESGYDSVFHLEAELSQPIKFPGKIRAAKAIAQGNLDLQQIGLEAFRQALRLSVRKEYSRLLALQRIHELRKEQLESASLFAEQAKHRAQSGFASDLELAQSEAALIAARRAMRSSEADEVAARMALNVLRGRPPSDAFRVSGEWGGQRSGAGIAACVAAAMRLSPEIRLASKDADLAEMELRAAKLERRPDFAVGPSLEYTETEQVIGLGVTLPLPLWDRQKGPIAVASGNYRTALAQVDATRADVAKTVAEAAERFAAARESAELYTPDFLDRLKAAAAQAEASLANNATTLLLYLEAKRTYYDSLADYYETLSTVAETRADLEMAMGCTLEELSNRGEE